MLTPAALVLVPMAVARAWKTGARVGAVLALIAGVASVGGWIDLLALAAAPATLAGPWVALLIGAIATSASWVTAAPRSRHETLYAAATLTLIALPWSPAGGVLLLASLLALGRWSRLRAPARPIAANDNDLPLQAPYARPEMLRLSYPSFRSARLSAFD